MVVNEGVFHKTMCHMNPKHGFIHQSGPKGTVSLMDMSYVDRCDDQHFLILDE